MRRSGVREHVESMGTPYRRMWCHRPMALSVRTIGGVIGKGSVHGFIPAWRGVMEGVCGKDQPVPAGCCDAANHWKRCAHLRAWMSAATYVRVGGRMACLSLVIDVASLRILGWAMNEDGGGGVMVSAIRAALEREPERPCRIFFMSPADLADVERASLCEQFGIVGVLCCERTLQACACRVLLSLKLEFRWRASHACVEEAEREILTMSSVIADDRFRHPKPYRMTVEASGLQAGA